MVESVAAGAEEFNSSVKEIAETMVRSKDTADSAVERVETADQSTHRLSAAAQSMGGIVDLINNITGQINLLALNATIESARAGEAGRGFAVVASEVKNLAAQAKGATEQISKDIADMRAVSSDFVGALGTIKQSIEEVREYVGLLPLQWNSRARLRARCRPACTRQPPKPTVWGLRHSPQRASPANNRRGRRHFGIGGISGVVGTVRC